MLNKNELKVLEVLLGNMRKEYTVSDISRSLKQKYPQTYKTVEDLHKKDLIRQKTIGRSKVIGLCYDKYYPEYAAAEIYRAKKMQKNSQINGVLNKLLDIDKQFSCILFGSFAARKAAKESDIDLLFIVPEEYDILKFERAVKSKLSLYPVDINVITEKSLFEMWTRPFKLNVGNEIFKSHIVLYGSEYFVSLLRRHYAG